MTANKMPEMPEAARTSLVEAGDSYYTADQMRAMYLAGIEAAKACVPEALNIFSDPRAITGFESCQQQVLTNLTALEQEAKK